MQNSRWIIITFILILCIFVAGCTNASSSSVTPTKTLTPLHVKTTTTVTHPITTTAISSDQGTVQSTSAGSSGVQIRITYSGTWSGSYYNDGTSSSVDGTGSKVISLDNAKGIVSASFQKKDNSQDELKVEILKDGDILKSGTTSASYGVVLVASSISGAGSSSSTSSSSSKSIQVKVNYNGPWAGAYYTGGTAISVEGSGSQTYTLTNPNYAVSAMIQKKDDSASELSVEIIEDGNILKTGSTTASYGIVSISTEL